LSSVYRNIVKRNLKGLWVRGWSTLGKTVDVDKFIQMRENEIRYLVNTVLNRAGNVVQQKIASGEINATMQDVLPLLLYEVLVTNTVATLRLVAEMLEADYGTSNQ